MWELTLGVPAFLLIILLAVLLGAVGMVILLAVAVNR
jgi:hypothetical protein